MRSATGAFAIAAALAVLYKHVLRKPILNWGATDEEASARMPGDELLEHADGVSTRAIDIDAPPAAVWPWLAQMGPSPRGGAYTYDWIENLLGLNMHSTARVLPEFQHPRVGDTFSLGSNRMRMDRVESERVLAWRSEDGNWVWTFVLEPRAGGTRLISRNRFRLPALGARVAMLPMEPGSLLMESKMLRGIKQRAEASRKRSVRQREALLSVLAAAILANVGADGDSLDGDAGDQAAAVDLYWLPLGAGGHFVRLNGRVYEAVAARLQRRPACDLYHSALQVKLPGSTYVIEQAPVHDWSGKERGVVAEGAVGSRWAGRFRIFRYEIRLWRGGSIPDVAEAVESPQRLTTDEGRARRVLDVVAQVPTPVWGRDELGTGEMWNSNSVIAWVIARSAIDSGSVQPPTGGRAPGWQAGLLVARRA